MGLLGRKDVLNVKGNCPVSGLLGDSAGLGPGEDCWSSGIQGPGFFALGIPSVPKAELFYNVSRISVLFRYCGGQRIRR